jgi:hypothetical protein
MEMARVGRSLSDLAREINRRAEIKRDFIAPASKFGIAMYQGAPIIEVVEKGGSYLQFGINDLAHAHIAEYAGIPLGYYKRMVKDDPALLAQNANRWLRDKGDDRRLIRTLDGVGRAVLSDRYRPLDNEDLADAVLPVIMDMGLMVISCEITDRRMYIKAVDKSITRDVPRGHAMGDGGHQFFDTLSPALSISNSEVGDGSLLIESGVLTSACTNLAWIGTNMRKYHVGQRAAVSEEVYAMLTDPTKKATDQAIWMQVRDIARGAFAVSTFEAMIAKLGAATKDRIDPMGTVETVERVGKRFSFTEGERRGVLARLIEGADLSRYGLHAAVTRFSQDVTVSYDRATELERIGGNIIEMEPAEWKPLAAASDFRGDLVTV